MSFLGFGRDKGGLGKLRDQLDSTQKYRADPNAKVEARLERDRVRYSRDLAPQERGPKYYWVLGLNGDRESYNMYFSPEEADRNLAKFDDGHVFELRTDNKQEAIKEIHRQLEEGAADDELAQRQLRNVPLTREDLVEVISDLIDKKK